MIDSSAFSRISATSTSVTSLPNNRYRRVNLTDPAIMGWEDIKNRLNELSQLPVGWDGYNAGPMRFEVGYFAAEIIRNVCDQTTYPPAIIPGPNGDVQLEWHHNKNIIELHIRNPYDVVAWRTNDELGENGEEIYLTTDFTAVFLWLKDFAEIAHAHPAAAA